MISSANRTHPSCEDNWHSKTDLVWLEEYLPKYKCAFQTLHTLGPTLNLTVKDKKDAMNKLTVSA
jgi:hypothetical protein